MYSLLESYWQKNNNVTKLKKTTSLEQVPSKQLGSKNSSQKIDS